MSERVRGHGGSEGGKAAESEAYKWAAGLVLGAKKNGAATLDQTHRRGRIKLVLYDTRRNEDAIRCQPTTTELRNVDACKRNRAKYTAIHYSITYSSFYSVAV